MQRVRKTGLGLVAIMALAGSLALLGCAENIEQTATIDVNNRAFTFTSGTVLHPALANVSTTLSFTNQASLFRLTSAAGTATGTSSFSPCTLAITASTYVADTGPQENDVIRLVLCDFDLTNTILILGNGTSTARSAPGVPVER